MTGYRAGMPALIRRPALRGYLLEEVLAWMLRDTAYDLLSEQDQDEQELVGSASGLRVQGRGTSHQIDVLGELLFTPPFSLPVRLLLEAKYHDRPCSIDVIRNAYGVLHDINQNYRQGEAAPLRRRYQYCSALFSASGFTEVSQEYALAHQISLIDLSGPAFAMTRRYVTKAADLLCDKATEYQVTTFPITWLRAELRSRLGTGGRMPRASTRAAQFSVAASSILDEFTNRLRQHAHKGLLLGFPAAPFILPLVIEDRQTFIDYARRHPDHRVSITRSPDNSDWQLTPARDPDVYKARFGLPNLIEAWISKTDGHVSQRARRFKTEMLSVITVYYRRSRQARVCQLRYQPGALLRTS